MNSDITCASMYFKNIFISRSDNEIEKLSQIKRFMERYTADNIFREKLNGLSLSQSQLVSDYGIDIDPQLILPLWNNHTMVPDSKYSQEQNWPLVNLYWLFISDLHKYRSMLYSQGDMSITCPSFHSWRHHQSANASSEMPWRPKTFTSSIIAFELSQGCSMGCWFCGVSAAKFEGYYPYTKENAVLWNDIIEISNNLFGKAMHTGFCYWATEPSDNPDYIKFITDYQEITGHLPKTTTAAPLKNINQTRELMKLSDMHCVPCRFSVVSLPILDKIHKTFSARELLGVDLICNNKESTTILSASGRAREYKNLLKESDYNSFAKIKDEHATIACISGFIINMMSRTIQLVSPVPASVQWPNGYKIYDTRHFNSKDEYKDTIMAMIATHMME